MESEFFEVDDRYHSGFVIQEYNGKWSLVSARQYETRDGETKTALRFGDIEVAKDKTKRLPVAVDLGMSRNDAMETLRIVLEHLECGGVSVPENDIPDDMIPF